LNEVRKWSTTSASLKYVKNDHSKIMLITESETVLATISSAVFKYHRTSSETHPLAEYDSSNQREKLVAKFRV